MVAVRVLKPSFQPSVPVQVPLNRPPLRVVPPPANTPPATPGTGFGRLFGGVGVSISMLWTAKTAYDAVKAVPSQLPWMPGPSVAPEIWTDPKRVMAEAHARFGHIDTPQLNQLLFIREKQALPTRRDVMRNPHDRSLMVQDENGNWVQVPLNGQETGALVIGDLWKNGFPRNPTHQRASDEVRLIELELGRRDYQDTPKTDADKTWVEQYAEYIRDLAEALRKRANGENVVLPMFVFESPENEQTKGSVKKLQPACSTSDNAVPTTNSKGDNMTIADERMNTNMQAALDDPEVEQYLRKSFLAGYKNMRLPNADQLVDAIFSELKKNPDRSISKTLEVIRNQISATWVNGGSVKDHWSQYYKDHEAPFITSQIVPHVTGKHILEVGTGRGWISYHLARALGPEVSITQTDVTDYREPSIKDTPQFNFVQISMDDPLPFEPNSFDTVVVVYVLHHHPDGAARESFLRKLSDVAKERLIIFEDTYLKPSVKPRFSEPQMDVMADFLRLTEQQQINALSFQCSLSNRVDGGGASVPTPCTFHDFDSLVREFKDTSGAKSVEANFLGIPKSKVYLNTEGVFVIRK